MTAARDLQQQEMASSSITALLVMIGFEIGLKTRYGNHFSKEDLLLTQHMIKSAIASEPEFIKWGLENTFVRLPYAAQQSFFNNGITPGFDAHKIARKLLIKNKIEHDIEQKGIEQIIFFSGGYDPRSFILSKKYPSVQFFELDRGETRKIKLNALLTIPTHFRDNQFAVKFHENHACFNDNLHLIECDFLKDRAKEELIKYQFDPNKKTLIIAEGLTPYLPKENNQMLLKNIYEMLNDNDEILISFRSAELKNPMTITNMMHWWSNEPFKFSILPQQVAEFVEPLGFELSQKMLSNDLLKWVDHPVANANSVRGDNYYLLKRNSLILSKKTETKSIADVPLISTELLNNPKQEYKPYRMCNII